MSLSDPQVRLMRMPDRSVHPAWNVQVARAPLSNVAPGCCWSGKNAKRTRCNPGASGGRTLVGRSVGESVVLKLPAMTRRLKIVELKTIHDAA